MIVVTQIKAARALLGWTQNDLAKHASLSLPSINNIERNLVSPRYETLKAIEQALIEGGVDFIDQSGVQLRPSELNIEIIEGPNWLGEYDKYIISEMKSAESEIVQFSCDEQNWMIYGSTTNHLYFEHREKTSFRERIIIPKSQKFVTNLRSVYRCYDDELFGEINWQVFGPYFSQIIWSQQKIILIRNTRLADAQRAIFNKLWSDASPLTDAQWEKFKKWTQPTSESDDFE